MKRHMFLIFACIALIGTSCLLLLTAPRGSGSGSRGMGRSGFSGRGMGGSGARMGGSRSFSGSGWSANRGWSGARTGMRPTGRTGTPGTMRRTTSSSVNRMGRPTRTTGMTRISKPSRTGTGRISQSRTGTRPSRITSGTSRRTMGRGTWSGRRGDFNRRGNWAGRHNWRHGGWNRWGNNWWRYNNARFFNTGFYLTLGLPWYYSWWWGRPYYWWPSYYDRRVIVYDYSDTSDLENAIEEYKEIIKELKEDVRDLRLENEKLQDRLEELTGKDVEADVETPALKKQIQISDDADAQDLKKALDLYQDLREELKDDVMTLRKTNEELRNKLEKAIPEGYKAPKEVLEKVDNDELDDEK